MSDTELHSGKLRLLEAQEGELLEQQCRRLWLENGKKEEDFDFADFFYDMDRKYMNIKGKVWEIFDHKELDASDSFCHINLNPDGSYSFTTSFYNGGTYFTEMVEEGLTKYLEKNK